MNSFLFALALAAAPAKAAPEPGPRIHQFSALALDPSGEKVASVETREVIGAVKVFHGAMTGPHKYLGI